MSETKEKSYGHFFMFEEGDQAVAIIPTEYSKNVEGIDMSKPQTIKSIKMEIKVGGFYYQIVEFENGSFENAVNLRPPDNIYTPELEEEHYAFSRGLRGYNRTKKKERSESKEPTKKVENFTNFKMGKKKSE